MRKVRVQRERPFCPHHLLLGAASCALEDAENKRAGYMYFELTAITFSALALEAMANSFGNKLIPEWEDYESASPIAKMPLVSTRLNIDVDFGTEPWGTAKWLAKFRNRVAHAKPELVETDVEMTHEEYEKIRTEYPESKLEKDITLNNAKRCVKAVDDILQAWCQGLKPEELEGLLSDGWSGSASHIEEKDKS